MSKYVYSKKVTMLCLFSTMAEKPEDWTRTPQVCVYGENQITLFEEMWSV